MRVDLRVGAAPASSGGGSGASLAATDLWYDQVRIGEELGWSSIGGAAYTWGASYLALQEIDIKGVRCATLQTSGTLTCKLWIGGVAVKTATATITAAGTYEVTFAAARTVAPGTIFTVSARDESSQLPSVSDPAQGGFPLLAGPALLILAPNLYVGANAEPTNSSSSYLFAASALT